MTDEKKSQADTDIGTTIRSHPKIKNADTICCYVSLPQEVATISILRDFLTQNKTVVVPKITSQEKLGLSQITTLEDLAPGSFSILEPKKTRWVPMETIDIFIIPGVAFTRQGHRIGWGKGYYDRLLAPVTVPRIGLAYASQIVPYIPSESYDILMTEIITEKEIIHIPGGI